MKSHPGPDAAKQPQTLIVECFAKGSVLMVECFFTQAAPNFTFQLKLFFNYIKKWNYFLIGGQKAMPISTSSVFCEIKLVILSIH